MYRKLRDNTVIRIKWHEGKLIADPGAIELTPVADGKFVAGPTEQSVLFESGTPLRMRMISPNAEVLFERVEPAQPTAAELAALAGRYESRETGTMLKLEPGVKPGEMDYRIGTQPPVTLRPTFRDAFETPAGASFYFVRDAAGKVVAVSVGEDRVWDLRFTRVR
jgi:hypothetical protein